MASLVARRTRQYPIDFGVISTFVETVEQAAFEVAACRFLAALRFSGLVEIEFARDGPLHTPRRQSTAMDLDCAWFRGWGRSAVGPMATCV